jgi:tetratricopeptide (TPR) repeat protein
LELNGDGTRDDAEKSLRRCIAIGEALVADYPSTPNYRDALAGSYLNLALVLMNMGPGRFQDAVYACEYGGKLFKELVAGYPGVPDYRYELAAAQNNLGELFVSAGNWHGAERAFCDSLEVGEALVASAPSNTTYRSDLANTKGNLVALLAVRADLPVHDPARASQLAREATELAPENASHWKALGIAHYRAGHWKDCIADMDEALRRAANGKLDPDDRLFLAMARWRLGEKEAARALFNQAATELAKTKTPDAAMLRVRAEAADVLGVGDTPGALGETKSPR